MAFYSQVDIFILGIRRSGNHAIANWLIPHYPGVVRYLNNYFFCEQMRPENEDIIADPFLQLIMTYQGRLFYLNSIIGTDIPTATLPNWAINNIKVEASANLFGCENQTPQQIAQIFDDWYELKYKRITQNNAMQVTDRKIFLLILRNPFNNLASLIEKHPVRNPNNISSSQFPATWIAYAKEYLGETSYLNNLGKFVTINYDIWFSNRKYRETLSAKLNQPFTDAGLEVVTSYGGGSSFDGITFSDRAQDMKVLERWKFYQYNPDYLSLLKNAELLALYKKIYGNTPFPI